MDGEMVNMADAESVSAFHQRLLDATTGYAEIDAQRELFTFEAGQYAAATERFRSKWGHDAYCAVEKALLEPIGLLLEWNGDGKAVEPPTADSLSGRTFGVRVSCMFHVDLPTDMLWDGIPITLTFNGGEVGGIAIPVEMLEAKASMQVDGLTPDYAHEKFVGAMLQGVRMASNVASGAITMETLRKMGVFEMTRPQPALIEGQVAG